MGSTYRSQSALEYMMTYGWAILIIVIVAAVLYSLGIFSPASSISATITGFAGLSVTTGECFANQGLALAFTDNTGSPINLTSINVTYNSVTQNLLLNNVIVNGGSGTLFIPGVCPSTLGSHYSVSVKITYTEPGQPLPGPYISSGGISGSSSAYTVSDTRGWVFTTYSSMPDPSDYGVDVDPVPPGGGLAYGSFAGMAPQNFPIADLNEYNTNSTGGVCAGVVLTEGFTASSTMYFSKTWINLSAEHDDVEYIFYKPADGTTWNTMYGNTGNVVSSNITGLTPGIYNVMVQWINGCGPGVSGIAMSNAFMEYSQQWSVTAWDGGGIQAGAIIPSGDVADDISGGWSGSWP
ncbi:hypothetical protein M1293_01670 [Candidatus Parvarchaeota archaeon]|nr:hypothetical protein [Candidatus Parvarchaeota archaeon]